MNDCDRLLLDRVLEGFGAAYDEAEGLLEDGEEGHPVRESAYYALALLMAGGSSSPLPSPRSWRNFRNGSLPPSSVR